mmetsp:Transcript_37179/g.79316  ORF Transcript_37179/g.79316 Transcript_37179/m.79316 type:complete len:417 (-) Transcript_37179:698-1948(-)
MGEAVLGAQSLVRINQQQVPNHVLRPLRGVPPVILVELVLPQFRHLQQRLAIVGVEGRVSPQQDEHDDPHGEQVGLGPVLFPPEYLRRDVPGSAAHGLQTVLLVLPRDLGGEAEVSDLDLVVIVPMLEEQILGLEVAMGDALGVHVLDGAEEDGAHVAGLGLGVAGLVDDAVEELAPVEVLGDQVVVVDRDDHVAELVNVLALGPQFLQYGDLLLQRLVHVLIQARAGDDFDGIYFPGGPVRRLLDLRKRPLSELLPDLVIVVDVRRPRAPLVDCLPPLPHGSHGAHHGARHGAHDRGLEPSEQVVRQHGDHDVALLRGLDQRPPHVVNGIDGLAVDGVQPVASVEVNAAEDGAGGGVVRHDFHEAVHLFQFQPVDHVPGAAEAVLFDALRRFAFPRDGHLPDHVAASLGPRAQAT